MLFYKILDLNIAVFRLSSISTLLWTLNVFLFGIFGFWPLGTLI